MTDGHTLWDEEGVYGMETIKNLYKCHLPETAHEYRCAVAEAIFTTIKDRHTLYQYSLKVCKHCWNVQVRRTCWSGMFSCAALAP